MEINNNPKFKKIFTVEFIIFILTGLWLLEFFGLFDFFSLRLLHTTLISLDLRNKIYSLPVLIFVIVFFVIITFINWYLKQKASDQERKIVTKYFWISLIFTSLPVISVIILGFLLFLSFKFGGFS
jgi:hypothetical protein